MRLAFPFHTGNASNDGNINNTMTSKPSAPDNRGINNSNSGNDRGGKQSNAASGGQRIYPNPLEASGSSLRYHDGGTSR